MGFLVLTHLSLNLVMVTHMMCIVNTLGGNTVGLYGVEGLIKTVKSAIVMQVKKGS